MAMIFDYVWYIVFDILDMILLLYVILGDILGFVPTFVVKIWWFLGWSATFLKKRENERKIEYNREKWRYREILRDIERYVEILWCIRLTDITEPYIEPWYIAPRYIISLLDHRKCKVLSVKYFYLIVIRQNESCKNYHYTS